MSASLGPKHYINVFSEPDVIRKQIKTAVTDSGDTPPGQLSAGVQNLFSLLDAAGGEELTLSLKKEAETGNLQYGKLKEAVAEKIISLTNDFREKRKEVAESKSKYIDEIYTSSDRIRRQAQQTITEVKDLVGLMNIKDVSHK